MTGTAATHSSARDCLNDALNVVTRLERRMTGWHSAVINATRNADRISLANDADSIRLELSVIKELIRDARGSFENDVRPQEESR